MPEFRFVLLYVEDPLAAAAFYAGLLDTPVLEQSPSFAMLALRDDTMLGLWSRHTVTPAPAAEPGAGEIGFVVADAARVQAMWRDWKARGLRIALQPTRLDFGTTFVALDPDGHRLRVFCLEP